MIRVDGHRAVLTADPNQLFGITAFNIPTAISKYLTYTLILHIIALAFAAAATVFGLLSHISSLSVLCFPTCFASIASSFSLLALVFDLVIFYIAKARIDAVDGASASIGISVWLTLAAWLVAGFGGCAYGVGRCCVNNRGKRGSGDPKNDNYYAGQNGPQTDNMRLQALRDEQIRKKEQGLPSFQELERTPLTNDQEDKYLYEEQNRPAQSQSALGRNGSVLQGVGVGYGRRTPGAQGAGGYGQYDQYDQYALQPPQGVARRGSASTTSGPGAAGVGAGGAGVEVPGQYGYYGAQHDCELQGRHWLGTIKIMLTLDYDQGQGQYNDPYAQQHDSYGQQHDQYGQPQHDQYGQGYGTGYDQQQLQQHSYPPAAAVMAMPQPGVSGRGSADPYGNASAGRRTADPYNRAADPYAAGDISTDSHYSNPGPQVNHADPYDAYDDGLGAIGRAATAAPQGQHQRDYTGGSGTGYNEPNPYTQQGYATGSGAGTPIHVPTPQHLTTHHSAQDLLRSPISPPPSNVGVDASQGYGGGGHVVQDAYNQPPSYDHAASGSSAQQYPQEKSSYR